MDCSNSNPKPCGGGYDGNTSSVTYSGTAGSSITIKNPTRTNYKFAGWQNGTIVVPNGTTTKFERHITSSSSANLPIYNNAGGGTVTSTIIADSTSETGYSAKIVTNGTASPGAGGIASGVIANRDKIYVMEIKAKIPTGYYMGHGSNVTFGATCDNGTAGTGEWRTYQFVVTTPNTKKQQSTFGFMYLNGTNNQSVTWYCNSYKVYELPTSSSLDYVFDNKDLTLIAKWTEETAKVNFYAEGGTVTKNNGNYSNYYSAGGVNATTYNDYRVNTTLDSRYVPLADNVTKTGYTFAGWWTASGGTGAMLISADGKLQAVTGYSRTSGSTVVWDTNKEFTLYAKWTAN